LKRERSNSSRFALTKELSETNAFPETTTMGGLLSKNASQQFRMTEKDWDLMRSSEQFFAD